MARVRRQSGFVVGSLSLNQSCSLVVTMLLETRGSLRARKSVTGRSGDGTLIALWDGKPITFYIRDMSWDITVFLVGSNPFGFLGYSGVHEINVYVGCHIGGQCKAESIKIGRAHV